MRRGEYRRILFSLAVLFALGAGGAYWLAMGEAGANPGDRQQVALGKRLYAVHCAGCHGDYLQGQPDWQTRRPDGRLPAPPHDASGHTWHHPDQQLFDITKKGVAAFAPAGYATDMRGYENELRDDEIWAILSYIKSTWPPDILAAQKRRNP